MTEMRVQIEGILAMLALQSEPRLTAQQLQSSFTEMFPNEPRLEIDEAEESFNVACGGVSMFVSPEAKPIPWGFLEEPCARSLFWPEATERMRRHTAHLQIIGFNTDNDSLAPCTGVTRLTAALVTCTDAVGVFWNSTPLVMPADKFRDMGREMTEGKLPLHLWIDFCAGADDEGRVHGYTNGLEDLGRLELEIVDARREPADVADVLYEVAHYLLDLNPDLFDDCTIGVGNNEQVLIRFAEPVFTHASKVIRLWIQPGY